MTGNKVRSNFALMDEMEEREMLESKDTLFEESHARIYRGQAYELLRKAGLTPLLVLGIILTFLCLVLPPFFLAYLGFGPVILIFGVFEKIFIDLQEKKRR